MDWPQNSSISPKKPFKGMKNSENIEISKFGRGKKLGSGTLLAIVGDTVSTFGNELEDLDNE